MSPKTSDKERLLKRDPQLIHVKSQITIYAAITIKSKKSSFAFVINFSLFTINF